MANKAVQIGAEIKNKYPGSILKHRVENGLVFQRLDGQEEHRYTTGPWHWRQKTTDPWKEIDTSLEDFDDEIWKHHIKSAKFDTFLADDGRKRFYPRRWITTEYVEFGALEWKSGDTWQVVSLGTVSIVGNKLEREETAVHKLVTGFTGVGSRTNLTIKTPVSISSLRWKVTLVGLDWDKGVLTSQSDNKKVGFIRPPYWTDSSESQKKQNIPWEYAGGYITLTPDFKDAVYPIIVDPDYSIIAGADDGEDDGSLLPSDTTIAIGYDFSAYNAWFRFAAIVAAQGANCTAATITVIATSSNNFFYSNIYGIDEDDHAAPTTHAEWVTDHGIHTDASVAWDETSDAWVTGDPYTSPDISDIFDELFGRGGWTSGYDVGLHVDNDTASNFQTRYIASYENVTYDPPLLSLTIAPSEVVKDLVGSGIIVFPR